MTTSELKKLKQLADIMFGLTDEQIENNIGELFVGKTNG